MRKKFFITIITLMMTSVFVLSACSNVESEDGAGERQEEITLTFTNWATGPQEEVINESISEFENDNPHITVERIQIPFNGYPDKIQTMMAGNQTPDVMYMSQLWFPSFVENGAFLDLTPYVEKDFEFDYDDFLPSLQETGEYNGGIYEIYDALDFIVLFYNKDMFDDAGIDYPDGSWTWDDLVEAGEALTQDTNNDGTIDQYGFIAPDGYVSFSWIWQNGGSVLNKDHTQTLINEPKSVEALQWIQDLIHEYKISPPPSVTDQLGTSDMFIAGDVAMAAYGHWLNPTLDAEDKFEYGVALLPQGKDNRNSFVSGAGYVIGNDTEHPEEAWELLKKLVSPEHMESLTELGFAVSSRQSVMESDTFTSNPDNEIFSEQTLHTHPLPVNPHWNQMFDIITSEYELMWMNEKTVQEGADAIAEQLDALLQED